MDFDQAIDAHLKWRDKILKHINSPDNTLDVATIGRNDVCPLGKWIESVKQQYNSHQIFGELIKQHTLFHKEVAAIVQKRNNNISISLQAALGPESTFSVVSKKVIFLLMQLKKEFHS